MPLKDKEAYRQYMKDYMARKHPKPLSERFKTYNKVCRICNTKFLSRSHKACFCSRECKNYAFAEARRLRRQLNPKPNPIPLVPIPKRRTITYLDIQSIDGLPCFGCDFQHICDSRFCMKLDEWLQND